MEGGRAGAFAKRGEGKVRGFQGGVRRTLEEAGPAQARSALPSGAPAPVQPGNLRTSEAALPREAGPGLIS